MSGHDGMRSARDPGTGRPVDPSVAFGEFLRGRRARLRPEDVGLPAFGRHRRVPGLRREELAQLAGLSVAYLTRLEQGKGGNVSDEVLDAVARALRLTEAEHAHLRDLSAGRRRRDHGTPRQEQVRPALRSMLASFKEAPAFVSGRHWGILAWNPAATALFGNWDRLPPRERNWARLVFLNPELRGLFTDTDTEAVAVHAVGSLRLYAGRRPDDPLLAELVDELSNASPEFKHLWNRHDVKEHSHAIRRLRHPFVGDLTLSFESFQLPDDPDQCLTVYHAEEGTSSADRLRLLISRSAEADATGVPSPR